MGRAPCCEKVGLNRGAWTREEDLKLMQHIATHGEGSWRILPKAAGLLRCGKSCRLRWINYLRPDLKRGNITEEEDRLIIKLHSVLGNRWSLIARRLPGRTDNEIKNHWNTHLKKKLKGMGIDPCTHQALERVEQAGYNNTMNNYQKQSSMQITPSAASMRYNVALPGPASACNNNNINININSPGPACVNPRLYDNYDNSRRLISTNPATKPQQPHHLAPFIAANPAANRDYKAKPMFYIDSDALKRLRSSSEDTGHAPPARAPVGPSPSAPVGPSPSTHSTHCSSGISSSSPSPSPSSAAAEAHGAIVSNINTTLQYCSSYNYTRISENDQEDYNSSLNLGDCSLKPINLEGNHDAINVEFMDNDGGPSVLSLLESDLTWDFDMVMHPMEEAHVPTPTHDMLQTLWGPSSWLIEQQEELI